MELDLSRASDIEEWILKRNHRSLLLRVSGTDRDEDSIDHIFVVDKSARRVHDPAERFSLKLRKGIPHVCIGDHASITGINEIQELFKQSARKGKRLRPKSTEKRRELRQKRRNKLNEGR